MRFDNDLLSFEVPLGMDAEEDDDGNILCFDPDDASVWLQVELGGVHKRGAVIPASAFLAGCYSAEITEGDAILIALDSQTALVARSITVEHYGEPYVVSYHHLAHNQTPDNLQIAQFGLAYPEARSATKTIVALRAFTDQIVRSAVLHPWLPEEAT